MKKILFITELNPEPWAMPTIGTARRGKNVYPTTTKNGIQEAYQEGLKGSVAAAYPNLEPFPDDMKLQLEIYVWRALDTYQTATGRTHTRHVADATNIQKATEDALQGILFKNDTQVKRCSTEIIEQGKDVKSKVLVICWEYAVYGYAKSLGEDFMTNLVPGRNVLYAETRI